MSCHNRMMVASSPASVATHVSAHTSAFSSFVTAEHQFVYTMLTFGFGHGVFLVAPLRKFLTAHPPYSLVVTFCCLEFFVHVLILVARHGTS